MFVFLSVGFYYDIEFEYGKSFYFLKIKQQFC